MHRAICRSRKIAWWALFRIILSNFFNVLATVPSRFNFKWRNHLIKLIIIINRGRDCRIIVKNWGISFLLLLTLLSTDYAQSKT